MAHTTGTATDYYDLLDKLRAYLLAQGWTINEWVDGGGVAALSKLSVTAPGNLGGQQPKMAFQTEWDTVANSYAWAVVAYPQFNAALDFGLQENSSPKVYLTLWPNTLDYWFYANDTRVIVIAKIGTYYLSLYSGFFLPYALPAEYPYPYFVGATFRSLQPFNYNDSAMRSFCDPGYYAAYYMRREGMDWGPFANAVDIVNNAEAGQSYFGPIVWPYRSFPADDDESDVSSIENHFFQFMRPPIGGKMPLCQCQIMDGGERCVAGVLDGVFATGGFNRAPEQIVSEGAQDYRLFININRNTPRGYFAVEEV